MNPWLDDRDVRLYHGDAATVLAQLPECSVQTVVTSPPYYGLRDYGHDGQIGLEPTPDEYVNRMVDVFREVRRVLRDDGTVWVNVGDSYASGPRGNAPDDWSSSGLAGVSSPRYRATLASGTAQTRDKSKLPGTKPKDLLGIPWLLAFALRTDGWYLRAEIIWAKPNPMPESVTDRPTRAHEQVFLLSKQRAYFYDADAVREPLAANTLRDCSVSRPVLNDPQVRSAKGADGSKMLTVDTSRGANRRTVWTVATEPYPGAHFAVMPTKLVEPCVLAGTPPTCCGKCGAPWERIVERQADDAEAHERPKRTAGMDGSASTLSLSGNGSKEWAERGTRVHTVGWRPTCPHNDDTGRPVVLDPFAGAGTVGVVARKLERRAIGIDLNPDYLRLASARLAQNTLMGAA